MAYTPQQNGVILNRCPTKALNNITPFEAYSKRKASIAHLKIFSSLCYVHVPAELRHKLESKSVKGVFVGYATCEKGYIIFHPISKKLTLSRDVTFDEAGSWNWIENSGRVVTPFPDESQNDVLAQCNPCIIEPEKYVEASQDSSWLKAMEDELHMIEENGTWELVDRPTGKPIIGVKWVCKTKLNLDGSFQNNKARIVATVYAQKSGLDYNETYALVANWTSLELSLL
ncbi:hypothetical protein L3X38_036733 [Prunus dulcis]|uniref:Reverse transcriptase Ty1/copia-type domain-containing protein n=1 Tax=Prunus dulcis TaxID=3755 RepID=A0AAD4V3W1_PRUDU|nr:hypothetical protein L3X38_036733 [Prunus dulcis]